MSNLNPKQFYHATFVDLKPGDTVDIKVVLHEELTSKQVITPDGTISIPLLGRVDVENKLETENGGD